MIINAIKQVKHNSSEEGFTLIELMIVVVIIGILAAIAIPIFMNQQKAAQDAVLKSDVKNMSVAVETWFAKHPGQLIMSKDNVGTVGYWSVIKRGTGSSVFRNQTSEVAPTDFSNVKVSDGSAVGVLSNLTFTQTQGYCILGSNIGSNYVDGSAYLYYDSLVGKIMTRAELSSDGACKRYITTL